MWVHVRTPSRIMRTHNLCFGVKIRKIATLLYTPVLLFKSVVYVAYVFLACKFYFSFLTVFISRTEELTKCCEPLQKLRVRLGTCKTGLSPPVTLCY